MGGSVALDKNSIPCSVHSYSQQHARAYIFVDGNGTCIRFFGRVFSSSAVWEQCLGVCIIMSSVSDEKGMYARSVAVGVVRWQIQAALWACCELVLVCCVGRSALSPAARAHWWGSCCGDMVPSTSSTWQRSRVASNDLVFVWLLLIGDNEISVSHACC